MKIKINAISYIIFFCTLLVGCEKEPTDEVLKNKFYLNEAKFNTLIKMAEEDKIGAKMRYIGIHDTDPEFPQKRWDIYKNIFNETGIESVVLSGYKCIILTAYAQGLAIGAGSSSKSYAYCPKPVAPIYRYSDQHGVHETTFIKLKDKWYLSKEGMGK